MLGQSDQSRNYFPTYMYVITVPDEQTDGQTDDILWHNRAAFCVASRGKKTGASSKAHK